jgi:hypothetical protein
MRTQMNQDKNCTSVHLHIPVWLVKRTRFFLLAVVEVNLTACGNFFLIVHYWCTHAMIDACGNELQTRAASATGTWTPRWTGSLHAAGRPPPRTDADDTMLTINIKQCELDAPAAADGILLNTSCQRSPPACGRPTTGAWRGWTVTPVMRPLWCTSTSGASRW